MKRIFVLFMILSFLIISQAEAKRRTYDIAPVIKQATYDDAQTQIFIWEIADTGFNHIVCDSFLISSNTNQRVTLAASDTIVRVHVTASRPIVSSSSFLWRGSRQEAIKITTQLGEVSVTLTGWQEE